MKQIFRKSARSPYWFGDFQMFRNYTSSYFLPKEVRKWFYQWVFK